MKKKIFVFLGATLVAGAMVFYANFSSRTNSFSDLALANVEAIAQAERIVWPGTIMALGMAVVGGHTVFAVMESNFV